MDRPPSVVDIEEYWSEDPPEQSAICTWWIKRFAAGWRPNKRVRQMGYYDSSKFYGVYIWEYVNVIYPMLKKLGVY